MTTDTVLQKRLLDHLRTAVMMLDSDLRVRYLNPAAEMLLATSASRMLGQRLPEYFFDDADARGALQQCMDEGHPFTRREARLNVAPGQQAMVDYSVSPIHERGQSMALLVEMQSLDRLLRITREEGLMHAHQATRALVRGVAHEIKNPLGGIRGAAQLLERALPDPELAEYPDGVLLRRDYDVSLPEVIADRDQLIQVLLNLMRNAMQALLEAGTEDARVVMRTRALRQFTIGAQRHRLVLRVDIEDNGPGISQALQETIFYPMVSGRANGSGLGLSIAQSIISQHQGLIECDSEPGRTCFSLLLPMEPVDTTESKGS